MNTLMKRANGNVPATTFSGMVDKLFQSNLNRILDDGFWGFDGVNHSVNVPVNIRHTDTSYELDLVAPGLKKEDFKVSLNRDTLTIGFEHKEENKQQSDNDNWLLNEYKLQSFTRSFRVDDTIDASKITASYADGILHVSLPKKEGAQAITRTIDIQ